MGDAQLEGGKKICERSLALPVVGVLYLFVPFYALYFLITRWPRTARPFVMGCCASFAAVVGMCTGLYGLGRQPLGGPMPVVAMPRPAPAVPRVAAPPAPAARPEPAPPASRPPAPVDPVAQALT